MIEPHSTAAQLVQFAFLDSSTPIDARVAAHVAHCEGCRSTVEQLRAQANDIRLAPAASSNQSAECLDDETIAMLANGDIDAARATRAFAHLLECGHCCHELASVARLFADSDVRAELEHLAQPAIRRRALSVRAMGGLAAVAAAAALIFFVVRPDRLTRPAVKPVYREQSFTAGVPPTLVAPIGAAVPTDTFRWKAVIRANRYRLTVFNRDGSVAWEHETPDTAVALPKVLSRSSDLTFLWRVEARVGWEDRWARSEMATFTLVRAPVR